MQFRMNQQLAKVKAMQQAHREPPLLENKEPSIEVHVAPIHHSHHHHHAGNMHGVPLPHGSGNEPESHEPTDLELEEGLVEAPGIVVEAQPTTVEAEGVGMAAGCKRSPQCVSWVLTILIWVLLWSLLVCNAAFSDAEDGFCGFFAYNTLAALGLIAVVAIIYYIECCCNGTGKYLRNVLQNEGAAQFVEKVKAKPAIIRWKVECYHWVTKTRKKAVTDSHGHSRTEDEHYREKVYTWRASTDYAYTTCIDVSGQLQGLDHYQLTKLRLQKTIGFVDVQSQNHYISERRSFRCMNWRDRHQEFHEEHIIDGFVDRILAESEPGVRPGWMTSTVYWLCSVVFMSPCFRHKFNAQCGNAQYTFVKQISAFN